MEIIKKTRLFYLIFVICSYTVGKRMYANFLDAENTKLFYKTSRHKEVKFNLQQTIAVLTLQWTQLHSDPLLLTLKRIFYEFKFIYRLMLVTTKNLSESLSLQNRKNNINNKNIFFFFINRMLLTASVKKF